jgi:hypothetical protein
MSTKTYKNDKELAQAHAELCAKSDPSLKKAFIASSLSLNKVTAFKREEEFVRSKFIKKYGANSSFYKAKFIDGKTSLTEIVYDDEDEQV